MADVDTLATLFFLGGLTALSHAFFNFCSALCTLKIPKAVHTIPYQKWLVSVSGTSSLDICVGLLLSIIKSYGLHRSTSVWVGSWSVDPGQKLTLLIIVFSLQSLYSPLPGRLDRGMGNKCN